MIGMTRLLPIVTLLAAAMLTGTPTVAQTPAPGAPPAGVMEAPATVVFAGGCFWCTESDFDKVPGVLETTSGYAGGHVENPGYRQVTAGGTGHREVVRVTYDPAKVSFAQLVRIYWRTVDPTDAGGQFCDRGESYTTAVFAGSAEDMAIAQTSRDEAAAALGREIVTPVIQLAPGNFYPAEEYHQDFHQRNQVKYRYYRWNCGRDQRLQQLWGPAAGGAPQG